jgi:uncharacterized protein (TIGR00730 family)
MNITVYCGSSRGDVPAYAQAARELGEWIASAGHSLVYGGSAIGLMGIVAGAALEGGAHVTGVEPRFFLESDIPQHDLPVLFDVETMSERKAKMIERKGLPSFRNWRFITHYHREVLWNPWYRLTQFAWRKYKGYN